MPASPAASTLTAALIRLRHELGDVSLALDVPDIDEVRALRASMVDQLEDYVLPRMVQGEAPLLAVVGGSTGAGKSTLVNSIVGAPVTASGVLRPTTRSPVLVHHPEEASWFTGESVLPDLRRTGEASVEPGTLHLEGSTGVPRGLALLDAPDVDSVDGANRAMASQLLAAADLWVFVTSAARYADQVPWELLGDAARRNTAVAIVLDRTAPESVTEVRGHLARMLSARGLKDSPLFVVPEAKTDADGLLPSEVVAELRSWLEAIATDPAARSELIRRTLDGAVRELAFRTHTIADAVLVQQEAGVRLRHQNDAAYDEARRRAGQATGDGTLLGGEARGQWRAYVGTGELARGEQSVGRLRERMGSALRGRRSSAEQVCDAVADGAALLLVDAAAQAAQAAVASWSAGPAGRVLVEASGGALARVPREVRERAGRSAQEWREQVVVTVREQASDRRTSGRYLTHGSQGLAACLMVVAVSEHAPVEATGDAAAGRAILEGVFGTHAVGELAEQVRLDLARRTHALLAAEKARFGAVLDGLGSPQDGADRLRDATRAVDDARMEQETR